jgi:hypothetical protein
VQDRPGLPALFLGEPQESLDVGQARVDVASPPAQRDLPIEREADLEKVAPTRRIVEVCVENRLGLARSAEVDVGESEHRGDRPREPARNAFTAHVPRRPLDLLERFPALATPHPVECEQRAPSDLHRRRVRLCATARFLEQLRHVADERRHRTTGERALEQELSLVRTARSRRNLIQRDPHGFERGRRIADDEPRLSERSERPGALAQRPGGLGGTREVNHRGWIDGGDLGATELEQQAGVLP